MNQEELRSQEVLKKIQERSKKEPDFQRISTLCFPWNHNSITPIIVGVWDKNNIVGIINTEYHSNNSYVKMEESGFSYFEDFNIFKKALEEHVAKGLEYSKKICDALESSDIESETTFLISIYRKDKSEVLTIKCPSSPISITENNTDVLLTAFVNASIEKEKDIYCIYVEIGNDPTQKAAGHSASLGYYNWRFELRDCEIINDNPLVIRTKPDKFKRTTCKMCRRL